MPINQALDGLKSDEGQQKGKPMVELFGEVDDYGRKIKWTLNFMMSLEKR